MALFCDVYGNKLNSKDKPNNEVTSSLQEEHIDEVNPSLQVEPSSEKKMIGFGSAISLGFTNYINFNGRSSRAEYWWWILFYILTSMIPLIGPFINLILIIATISLTTRRLHDIGKTGWWQLIFIFMYILLFALLIPFIIIATVGLGLPALIIWFILFLIITICWIRWMATKGNDGPNKFGPPANIFR